MRGYRFEEEDTGRFALTRDAAGPRLPALGSVWRFAGPLEIEAQGVLVGAKPGNIREAILEKGYFLWPDDARKAPG
jgi:hypothetical protein